MSARDRLASACEAFGLPELFRGVPWAVFGGAVRDSLLAPTDAAASVWPDIDIAVCGDADEVFRKIGAQPRVRETRLNSFGGIWLRLADGGEFDIWTATDRLPAGDVATAWRSVLDQIDFGINAAAYVHGTRSIVLHEQWLADAAGARIECLAPPRPERGRQVARSMALFAKMEPFFGGTLAFGERAGREIIALYDARNASHLREGWAYVKKKVEIGRWPESAQTVFERFVREANGGH